MANNRHFSLIIAVAILGSGPFAGVVAPQERTTPDARVEATLVALRLDAAVLEDVERRSGELPVADGQQHPFDAVALGFPADALRKAASLRDAWGHGFRYVARGGVYQLISAGSDGRFDVPPPRGFPALARIEEAVEGNDDLIVSNGRMIRRPYGDRGREFRTLNDLQTVMIAASTYAIDNNAYPGDAPDWTPVAGLEPLLVPVYLQQLPTHDAWGRPLLFRTTGVQFTVSSVGTDGIGQWDVRFPACGFGFPLVVDPGDDLVIEDNRILAVPPGLEP